jgi:hypothetical protein
VDPCEGPAHPRSRTQAWALNDKQNTSCRQLGGCLHSTCIEGNLVAITRRLGRELAVGFEIDHDPALKAIPCLGKGKVDDALGQRAVLQGEKYRCFAPNLRGRGRGAQDRMAQSPSDRGDRGLALGACGINHALLEDRDAFDLPGVGIQIDARKDRVHQCAESAPARAFLIPAFEKLDRYVRPRW